MPVLRYVTIQHAPHASPTTMHCTISHCTAPHHTASHRTASHRTALHRTSHRTAPHHTASHRTASHRTAHHNHTTPHATHTTHTSPHRSTTHHTNTPLHTTIILYCTSTTTAYTRCHATPQYTAGSSSQHHITPHHDSDNVLCKAVNKKVAPQSEKPPNNEKLQPQCLE